MIITALIVAAGGGERAGGGLPKQYRQLGGKPVLAWSVDALAQAGVDQTLIVIAPEHEALCRASVGPDAGIVIGGASRTASVRAGLAALGEADILLIHDAARPGLTPALVRELVSVVEAGAIAAAPALPVTDALRRVGEGRLAGEAVKRDGLVRVQTPQAFRLSAIRSAYAAAPVDGVYDDDIAIAQLGGYGSVLIAGDPRLMKLTYPEDFAVLERILTGERINAVGLGFDAHRFGPGDHVTLCGVRIAYNKGLIGHSDADAGWHALVDAILGALGEGDIGVHFPPDDPQWKGADSERFLRHARQLAEQAGARIVHVDVTIVCERPKIGPHREAMRARTAAVLGLPLSRVSVKATTTEQLGFLGREEGLAAQAIATLERPG